MSGHPVSAEIPDIVYKNLSGITKDATFLSVFMKSVLVVLSGIKINQANRSVSLIAVIVLISFE